MSLAQDTKSADELRKEKKRRKKEKKAHRLEAELIKAEHSEVLPEQQPSNELNELSLEKSNKWEREERGDDAGLKGVEKKKKEKKEKKKTDDDIVMSMFCNPRGVIRKLTSWPILKNRRRRSRIL